MLGLVGLAAGAGLGCANLFALPEGQPRVDLLRERGCLVVPFWRFHQPLTHGGVGAGLAGLGLAGFDVRRLVNRLVARVRGGLRVRLVEDDDFAGLWVF